MTTPPDHDELRIRGRLREHIDGTPAPAPTPTRTRDWLDDLWDDTPPTPTPAKPMAAKPEPEPAGEPRWDWRRLLHWPYARPCCGATAALLPLFHGQSAALGWGDALHQARVQAGIGPAWIIATVAFGTAAVIVHRRRGWISYGLLTCAFVGTVAMASPYDIVTFITGAHR